MWRGNFIPAENLYFLIFRISRVRPSKQEQFLSTANKEIILLINTTFLATINKPKATISKLTEEKHTSKWIRKLNPTMGNYIYPTSATKLKMS